LTALCGRSDFLLTDLTSQLCPESVRRLVRRRAVDGGDTGGGDAALTHLKPLWTPLRCGYKLKALAHCVLPDTGWLLAIWINSAQHTPQIWSRFCVDLVLTGPLQ
jgi:hypothetical protein